MDIHSKRIRVVQKEGWKIRSCVLSKTEEFHSSRLNYGSYILCHFNSVVCRRLSWCTDVLLLSRYAFLISYLILFIIICQLQVKVVVERIYEI